MGSEITNVTCCAFILTRNTQLATRNNSDNHLSIIM